MALLACLPDIIERHRKLEVLTPEAEHDANILGSVFGLLSIPTSLARIVSEDHLSGAEYLEDFKSDTMNIAEELNKKNLACSKVLDTWDMNPAFFQVFQTRQSAVQGLSIVSLFLAEAMTPCAETGAEKEAGLQRPKMRGIQFAEMYPILLRSAHSHPNFVPHIRNMLTQTLRNQQARQTMAKSLKNEQGKDKEKTGALAFSALVVKCGIKMSDPLCTHLENNRSEDCKFLTSHIRAGWAVEKKVSRKSRAMLLKK